MPILKIKDDKLEIPVQVNDMIVDVCEDVETSILFGCRDGACGACLVKVIENPQNLSPIQSQEQDFLETLNATPDERLACQCAILGDVTLEVSQ